MTFAAAILAAIVLTTAWSISMLPRARDVAATIQALFSNEIAVTEMNVPSLAVWKQNHIVRKGVRWSDRNA
jgi:hypothetical protein